MIVMPRMASWIGCFWRPALSDRKISMNNMLEFMDIQEWVTDAVAGTGLYSFILVDKRAV